MECINNNDKQPRFIKSSFEKVVRERVFILKTKLFPPPLRDKVVYRSRLTDRLKMNSEHRLTLLSAPAGYGKTTLTSEWLKDINTPYSWLSLDTGDDDPFKFFTYFLAALQRIDDTIGEEFQGVFLTYENIPLLNIMGILINDIIKINKNFILVLDDFHVIQNKIIHEAMQYLLDNMPPVMHIMLLTRNNPPLFLSRLRARGHIIEIHERDLCFTEGEVEEFLCRTIGINMEKHMIKILEKKTEGWIAGLQLAGLNLKGMDFSEIASFIDDFTGSNRYVFDYLIEEILNKSDNNIMIFLYHTSILKRFNTSLCDFIIGDNQSRETLDYLEKMNLFLIPLDDKREWYRYHHIFSEFLQEGLGTFEKKTLHLKAAVWMENNDFLYEAVEHAIVSKDLDTMERLIEKAFDQTYLSTKFPKIEQWLDMIPEKRLLSNGNLSSYKAWCYFVQSRPEEALAYVSLIKEQTQLFDKPMYLGRIMSLRGAILATKGQLESIEMAQKSIELIDKDDSLFLTLAYTTLGSVYSLSGNAKEAEKAFKEAMNLSLKYSYHTQYISTTFFCANSLNKQGRRREAEGLCLNVLNKYKGVRDELILIHIVYISLGMIYYDNDDLVNAEKYLSEGIKVCKQLNVLYVHNEGEWSLAFLQLAMENSQEALKIVWEAQQSAQLSKIPRVISHLKATEAYINFKNGDLTSALLWTESVDFISCKEIKPYLELEYYIYIRIILANGQFKEAEGLLKDLESSASEGKRFASLIKIHILQAILQKLQNSQMRALEYLGKSITYAAHEGYYRPFLDVGEEIEDLLPKLRKLSPNFINELLMKLGGIAYEQKLLNKEENENPLSERELEVLKLISLGLSNRDIGDSLFITVGTTKNHVSNICSKLEVKKRTEAVIKAKKMGYI